MCFPGQSRFEPGFKTVLLRVSFTVSQFLARRSAAPGEQDVQTHSAPHLYPLPARVAARRRPLLQCQQPLLPADRALQSRLMLRAGRVETAVNRK